MKDPPSVEILVIGNELLSGTTLDTNSYWISLRLTKLGFKVQRKTTVRDELDVISKAFREAIRRKPAWIISLGGLGPTFDDMSLEGLAKAVGRTLELNPIAVKMLKERYRTRAALYGKRYSKITKTSLKMARIPIGSTPLQNSQGSAPGVLTQYRGSKIVSLPGVPREMKAIFIEQLKPILEQSPSRIKRLEQWIYVEDVSESRLAPVISKLVKKYSERIYVKSHPFGFKKGKSVLKIQMIVETKDENNSRKLLDNAAKILIDSVRSLDGISRKI